MICPAVVRRVTVSSAQLASQCSHSSRSQRVFAPPKVSLKFFVALKYLQIRFTWYMCWRVGFSLCLPRKFAAYATSGRVLLEIHWALPTSSRNSLLSSFSSSGDSGSYLTFMSSGLPAPLRFVHALFPNTRSMYGVWLIFIVLNSLSRTIRTPRKFFTSSSSVRENTAPSYFVTLSI